MAVHDITSGGGIGPDYKSGSLSHQTYCLQYVGYGEAPVVKPLRNQGER